MPLAGLAGPRFIVHQDNCWERRRGWHNTVVGSCGDNAAKRLHENNADLHHPRSTARGHLIKVSANLDNVAESGLCPTRISALLLGRTLHQILLFPSKEIQWRVSGMECHTDRTRTPTCRVTTAPNVNELRTHCTQGSGFRLLDEIFTHGWSVCRGHFSSHQKGQLKLWLVSTTSTAIGEISKFNSECWLLSSLLKRVCMGHTVCCVRRESRWPLFCRAREPRPQFNTIRGSLF